MTRASRFSELDPVIHAPNRLQICALLMPLLEAEFQLLREELGVSDSVLSKQIKQLETAGYLRLRKNSRNGRQRTWVRMTSKGRRAFQAHLGALRQLAGIARGEERSGGEDLATLDPFPSGT